jgi:cytochrome P450
LQKRQIAPVDREGEQARFLGAIPEGRHRQALIPFGAGQRPCIGRDLSLIETQIILPMLLQRFTLAAVPGRIAQPKLAATFVSKGVHVYLGKRNA